MGDLDYYYSDDPDERLRALEKRLDKLEHGQAELAALNKRLNAAAEKFVHASRSSLWNPNILVRAFYIYGHNLLATFVVLLFFFGCYALVFLLPLVLELTGIIGG